MWIFNKGLAKSHFYVWYLGSKEADGVRGSAVVLPAMRQLLRDSFRRTPNKATVQISGKGLKLIQTVPTMGKSGKIKMQLVKFQIAASSITYSMTGKPPFDDVIAVVMLVFNPEMHSPIHVHCYRCDSAETAAVMQANLQVLIGRPETQRSIAALEQRLFKSMGRRLPSGVVDELKRRLSNTEQSVCRNCSRTIYYKIILFTILQLLQPLETFQNCILPKNKAKNTTVSDRYIRHPDSELKLRMFGDTIVRSGKCRSVDNLNIASQVSR
uniref:PID domain-containing protein n=1 Tax=Syphacia muris TaxID=451379 RepID=A0A0N5AGK8_9BILA